MSGQGTNDFFAWRNIGSLGSNLYLSPGTFFDVTYPLAGWQLITPCGGFVHTYTSGGPISKASMVQSPNDLPNPPTGFSFRLVWNGGPDAPPFPQGTIYDSPGDVWISGLFSNGGTPTNGWHHYICSFDTSQIVVDQFGANVIRVQLAMDRGGGPISGGPVMDTAAQTVTDISQPMWNQISETGNTGELATYLTDEWTIGAPIDAPVDFAYCYMGIVPVGGNFFDLTIPRPDGRSRLDYFITPQLTPENLGFQGQNVPLLCNWMHTDSTRSGAGGPYFAVNAPDGKAWTVSGGTMTATDGPPIGA